MKNWFPFTDYDFYGYLSSGILCMVAFDYSFNQSFLLKLENWTFFQGVIVVALAYFIGQAIAIPAALFLEQLIVKKILGDPFLVAVGIAQETWITKILDGLTNSKYRCAGLKQAETAKQAICTQQGVTEAELTKNPRLLFDAAFKLAKNHPKTQERLAVFLNQYGMHRNMSLALMIASGMFYASNSANACLFGNLALGTSILLFIRFVKFYSHYSNELARELF